MGYGVHASEGERHAVARSLPDGGAEARARRAALARPGRWPATRPRASTTVTRSSAARPPGRDGPAGGH